jgi:hypothetical protein
MQMDLVFPQSVCAALALELYFKTLYLLEKGVDFKNNKGKFSHDFHSLFGSLDKKTRDMVSFAFDKLIRQQDLSYVKTCSHFSNETGMEGNDFHCLEESVNIRTSRRRS